MKKTMIGAAVLAVLVLSACKTGQKAVSITDFSGEWNIVNVNGQTVSAESIPYIGFDQKTNRVYGHTGCNRLMGNYHVDSLVTGKMNFGQMATTRMMCPDMTLEQRVLEALGKVAGFAQVGDTVELKDAEGKPLMTLLKRVKPAIGLSDLAGRWVITNVGQVLVSEVERTPELNFDIENCRVYGNASCNTINGNFSQEEGKATSLRFSQMISTMMACPNMEMESGILQALDKVRSFDRGEEENTVILLDESGFPVLTLKYAEDGGSE